MIAQNDLRVGNYVYNSLNQPVKVEWLQIKHARDFKPIPLTTRLLVKAGFKQFNKKYIHESMTPYIYKGKGYYGNFITPEIESVHQLQNIFFALTGKELEIIL